MLTIIETSIFIKYSKSLWTDEEREEFIIWIANNPLAGDLIIGSGGCRKVRWSRAGVGKRGGARVIYYNVLSEGQIGLLIVYTKAKFDNLPLAVLMELRNEFTSK